MKTLLLLASAALAVPAADARPLDPTTEVDALFKQWSTPTSPGCAVGVWRDGKALLERGYGQASVEAGIANTPQTAFHIASLSKQFTAFLVLQLQAEGKLSVGDDIRKYVPELHAFAQPITIGHLLHHSSGLRDQLSLLWLQGRRGEDTATQEDMLQALFGQRELNFAPGAAFGYSNSNYTLLALVVERITGKRFGDVLAERIFRPLGMTRTYLVDDIRRLHAGEAAPYGIGDDKQYERRIHAFSTYGSSDIRSTVGDLARWAANFDRPKVGTPAILAEMLKGDPVTRYGGGLAIGRYRGVPAAGHSGLDPGFVSHFMVMPDQRFAVSVLCNVELDDPVVFARKIADIYLAGTLKDDAKPAQVAVPEAELTRIAGTYRDTGGMSFLVQLRDGRLMMQGGDPMIPHGGGLFSSTYAPVTFAFSGEAPAKTLTIVEPGGEHVATRYVRRPAEPLTPARMAEYLGDYYSPELGTIVTVERRKEELWLKGPGYAARINQPPPEFREADAYQTESVAGAVRFRRDASGRVTELTSTNGRVVDVRFLRFQGLPKLGAD